MTDLATEPGDYISTDPTTAYDEGWEDGYTAAQHDHEQPTTYEYGVRRRDTPSIIVQPRHSPGKIVEVHPDLELMRRAVTPWEPAP